MARNKNSDQSIRSRKPEPNGDSAAKNGTPNGTHQSEANSKPNHPPPLPKPDASLDQHHSYEFGGPVGCLGMMTFFPLLMYYFWICLVFNDGKLMGIKDLDGTGNGWKSLDNWELNLKQWGGLVREHASPNPTSLSLYIGLMIYQAFLALVVPGYPQEGLPVQSLKGRSLMYNCNALGCFYLTLITTFILQLTGKSGLGLTQFSLSLLIDHYGSLMTVSMICGFSLAFITYIWTIAIGHQVRMSGNFIYDYFMGAGLNPRIGSVDIKMWCEVRIPWVLMFLLALGGAAKQWEEWGYVSWNMGVIMLGTGLYINACAKGEECIPQTWDMAHEKFGWLLSFWNLSGVPFMYPYSTLYMATHDPQTYRFPGWTYVLLYGTLLGAYYVFDTSMSQKSRFKAQQTGTYTVRKTFPQLPWGMVENPKYLKTRQGGKLLIDGWWAYLRKPNYSADAIQLSCWSLCSGFDSILPYWLPFFFIVMLIHRCTRDFERCARKYGEDWVEYCRIVPYKFIPYIY